MTLLADDDRILPIECGFNFRDFGGYATHDGSRVKPGMLYRAGVMAFVEGAGRDRLAALGIASICDLRTSKERNHRPTRWHEGLDVELWSREYNHTSADLIQAIESGRADATAMREMMIDLYRDIAYDHAPSYRALFELLGSGKVPLVVNCSAGKDRTGTAVALVLGALGVSRDTILADYVLTARADFDFLFTQTRRSNARALPADAVAPLIASDPVYLETLFETLDARSGSVEAYLAEELGVGDAELAKLRELLVEG